MMQNNSNPITHDSPGAGYSNKISKFYGNYEGKSPPVYNMNKAATQYYNPSEPVTDKLDLMNSIKQNKRLAEFDNKDEERVAIDKNVKFAADLEKSITKEDKQFRKQMGQDYIKQMADHKRKALEDKLRAINEDNQQLNVIQKQEMEEQYHHS